MSVLIENMKTSVSTHKYVLIHASLRLISDTISVFLFNRVCGDEKAARVYFVLIMGV